MEDAIYLVQPDGSLVEMVVQPYQSEPLLQELLAKYPHLLAGGQMNQNNPRRWLLIAREMGIPWEEGGGDQLSLDHLFLDQEGIPTLVEVKRSSDTRIRREVIGQMLEYAANAVVYWPVEKIKARFESRCMNENLKPEQELFSFLGSNDDSAGEIEREKFWQQVHTNLKAGRLRMVFVADEIPFQLRRIVEFLNEQMETAEVLAVEVKQYIGSGLQTLVPRIIGQTTQTGGKGPITSENKQWDETSFFNELAKRAQPVETEIARRILTWAGAKSLALWWGKGKKSGSVTFGLLNANPWHQFIGLWTNGSIEFKFEYMIASKTLNDEQRLAFLKRVNQTFSTAFPDEYIYRRPSVPMTALSKTEIFAKFLEDLEWALFEIENGLGSTSRSSATLLT